jgi:hypothetical protein
VRLLIVRSARPIARTSPIPVSAGFVKRQFQKTPLKLSRAFRLPQSPVSAILTAVLDAIDPSIP